MTKTGWVSPMGDRGEALIHVAGKQVMMCARKEDKILPATVIKQALQDKVEKLEGEQGRKLKKTEKATLKMKLSTRYFLAHLANSHKPLFG
ncbi:recombination associated protein RdgC [Proteus mirabilis]|uniref:Recombination-associated protein RdgC n=1 Tax=Proteus mirabilis TaxID=584 RepID=A0A379FJF3_PROMI|nr:recombination associated protein RdgC [Proteus mirabilis]